MAVISSGDPVDRKEARVAGRGETLERGEKKRSRDGAGLGGTPAFTLCNRRRFESQRGTQARHGSQLDATGLPIEEMLACCTVPLSLDFLICKVGRMTPIL